MRDHILIEGAREHNLKNITVRIPRNSLTVITGLSGSGKSSLAFDTLYAEGQRQYVESLSPYARQFLEQMQKPDVGRIEGLSPAIAIEQHIGSANPRSIVATSTDIYDYLRVLFAAIGRPYCPKCGRPVRGQSAEQIVQTLMGLPPRTKLVLLAPLVRGQKGSHSSLLDSIRKQGFVRVRIDGTLFEIEAAPELDRNRPHTIEVVVDRLIVTSKITTRFTESVEMALRHGNGIMIVLQQEEGRTEWKELLFSEKNTCPDCGISFEEFQPRSFSFNSPYGACPRCSGLGTILVFDEDLVVPDPERSLRDGAIQAWRHGGRRLIIYFRQLLQAVAQHYGFSLDTPFKNLTAAQRRIVLYGSGKQTIEFGYWRAGSFRKYRRPFEGVIPNLIRRYKSTQSEYMRQRLRAYMNPQPCPECLGKRLKPESRACTIAGRSIVDVTAMSIQDAYAFFDRLCLSDHEQKIAGRILDEVKRHLQLLLEIGLGYLTLDRQSSTLAGGEAQRLRLAAQIGSGLTGVLYVLDEPTVGLHQRDIGRLITMLKALRDQGNTVVVVEHDEQMIKAADYVIDLGPGAGRHGGHVVFAGSVPELLACTQSLTARFLTRPPEILSRTRRMPGKKCLRILGAAENNLKNIDVTIPLGLFVCVTGVSGSGKSTLVDDILRRALCRQLYGAKDRPGRYRKILGIEYVNKVIVIDQSPIGRTPRSNPATYTGAFDEIRKLFAATPSARLRGYGPGRFSFNLKGGRCEICKGDGLLRLEMHFLPDVYVTCEACHGQRYNQETLSVRYGGKNIAEILSMTVDEALEFFENIPVITRKLKILSDAGLGYLQLGQSATTLSGGEAQRVKLAAELSRVATGQTLYLLDEPTTGLHFADVQRLLDVLLRLRDAGNTVLVIEHNLEVIKTADYIIDLGPEGGDAGGRIVAAGSPEEVADSKASYTGQFLKPLLAEASVRANNAWLSDSQPPNQ